MFGTEGILFGHYPFVADVFPKIKRWGEAWVTHGGLPIPICPNLRFITLKSFKYMHAHIYVSINIVI